MTPDAEAKARALAEAVLNRQSVRWPVDQARALLAALLREPERLDREMLARALCDEMDGEGCWGEFLERTRDQWRTHADAILARLEADR